MIRLLIFFFIVLAIPVHVFAQKHLVLSTHDTAVNWICSEILVEAYEQLGLNIQIEKYPSKRSLLMSNSGQVDGEVCRAKGIDKNYSNLLIVPIILQSTDAVIFTKKNGLIISGWNDLKPYKIGALRGAELAERNTKGMEVHFSSTIEQLFHMLDTDRLDVVVMERIMGLVIIKRLKLEGISFAEPPLVTFNLYHYVHKKQSSLIPSLVKVLQDMKINRIKEIQDNMLLELH